jgi:hypothetical protein
LCYDDLAVVIMLLGFTLKTKSASFGLQSANFGVDVTAAFTAAFG